MHGKEAFEFVQFLIIAVKISKNSFGTLCMTFALHSGGALLYHINRWFDNKSESVEFDVDIPKFIQNTHHTHTHTTTNVKKSAHTYARTQSNHPHRRNIAKNKRLCNNNKSPHGDMWGKKRFHAAHWLAHTSTGTLRAAWTVVYISGENEKKNN